MTAERYRIEPLGDHHDRAAFASGTEALDRYLREQAGQDIRRGVTRVFVLHDAHTDAIAGYYTLSSSNVRLQSLPADVAKRLGRYEHMPVILLGRLALDGRYQGQGLGRTLLADALLKAYAVTATVAAFAVVVDAKDDAARAFYERNDFRRMADDEHRLFIPMQRIAASLL
jgi:GNAT superfamily N-acetyltransferase